VDVNDEVLVGKYPQIFLLGESGVLRIIFGKQFIEY
jgi:hypothetical protein